MVKKNMYAVDIKPGDKILGPKDLETVLKVKSDGKRTAIVTDRADCQVWGPGIYLCIPSERFDGEFLR